MRAEIASASFTAISLIPSMAFGTLEEFNKMVFLMNKSDISIEYLHSYPCIKVNFLMARLVHLFRSVKDNFLSVCLPAVGFLCYHFLCHNASFQLVALSASDSTNIQLQCSRCLSEVFHICLLIKIKIISLGFSFFSYTTKIPD